MRDWRDTAVTRALGVRLPLLGAPMTGGPTTPALVAAVSDAGGFGVLDGGSRSPDQLREALREVRRLTGRPFGVNLLVAGEPDPDPELLEAALAVLAVQADEVGVPWPPDVSAPYAPDLAAQVAVALEARPVMLSFAFALPPADAVTAAHEAGVLVGGTATSPDEAVALVAAGVDLVSAQGAEAGGHRGTFLRPQDDPMLGLAALVPQVVDAVDVPVVAAGGLMDGRAIAAALVLGAAAAQLGTAFLRSPEAGTSPPYRAALEHAGAGDTVITSAFSGRPARGLRNAMSTALAGRLVPPYPVTNALTRDLRRRAAERGDPDHLSLWAGQGVAAARELPAAELVAVLEREVEAALAGR